MNRSISVKDFGAYGDGIHDDRAAIQAALDSGAAEITIPQGIYPISDTLWIGSDTAIVADGSAKLVMKSKTRRQRGDFLLSNRDLQDGNRNIRIIGGIWDGNNQAPENQKPDIFDKAGYSGSVLNFFNVEGLTLENMVLANSVTYNLRLCRVRDFSIRHIDFISDRFGVNQDGVHLGGGVRNGVIRDIRALSYGQTNDDLIAMNADDSVERVENLDLVRDAIENITVENIYAENCHTIVRMLSVTAPIRNITFKNVYGGFRCNALNADAARYCRTPLFRDEDYPQGVGCIENVRFDHFVCYPVDRVPEGFGSSPAQPLSAILLESQASGLAFRDFQFIHAADSTCVALTVKNLTDSLVCADGITHPIREKSDTLALPDFKELSIDRSE